MVRVWTLSDLHQDWPNNAYDPTAHAPSSFDVVVVAGDLDTPGTSAVDRLADWFSGVPVVYVLGNHDLYRDGSDDRYTYAEMYARARDQGAARGIIVLVDDSVVIDGVRFVGGTLWTNMRLGTHSRGHALNTARRGMNDYRCIRRGTGSHRHLRVEETIAMHGARCSCVEDWLRAPFDGPTVVVTHHAPSPRSLSDSHMDLRWCYASNLEHIMDCAKGPDLWIHGHLHSHSDYQVGETRVVANPRGHAEEAAKSGFVPDMVIDLSA